MTGTSTLPNGIKLGVTLFSFTYEYHSRKYSFADLVREVARRGLGPGLEVVAAQSFRHFPELDPKEVAAFEGLIEETGLVRTCLDLNADIMLQRGQIRSVDEIVANHSAMIRSAARLGFSLVRYQYGATPEVVERLIPVAEETGVRLGLELHAPHHVDHPDVLRYREMYERKNSPMLGFIADFGATSANIPKVYIDYYKWRNIPDALVAMALQHWRSDEIEPFERRAHFIEAAKSAGFDEIQAVEVSPIFNLFFRAPPSSWLAIMPRLFHVHAKFFGIGDDGRDASIDHEAILPVLVEGGYGGYLSSEYEGHHVCDPDAFSEVERHQVMVREILSGAGAAARGRAGS